jgi:Domain of unknown function (DUF4249)
MRLTNISILFWLLLCGMLPSCITPFEPHISSKDINKYVVVGQVTNNNEYQTVSVSMAAPVGNPHYIPVSGCSISIFDDKFHEFVMQESGEGLYRVAIDGNYMLPGAAFKVVIITPDGTNIESDFDTMNDCPDVDSVYFIRKELISDIPGQVTKGLQFYLDLNAGNVKSRFFKWDLIETWEYHSVYPREWYYDGSVHHITPPDYSRHICWATELEKNIYTLSTENLVGNKYTMFPLNFVNNHTPKLIYGYSLLINQYALSEGAYTYWDQMRINSSDQGGLYEKQPLSITGNLHNLTDPGQEVLGFFSASMVKSKRLFISNVENLEIDFPGYCGEEALEHGGFLEINPGNYPAFLKGNAEGYWLVALTNECVDCLTVGGTNVKPDFWPY